MLQFPSGLKSMCKFLAENGYRTLSAEEFLSALRTPSRVVKKSVLLTFDDGLKHVWTIAFPILKKYGLQATCFLIPGCISNADKRIRPNLENYWKGEVGLEDLVLLGKPGEPLVNWEEISKMHESGVIDFQSHTMYHSLVFTSNQVVDFVHPQYDTHFYGNVFVPLYSRSGQDVISRDPILGMPIYAGKPRMIAHQRFYDDEGLRDYCVNFVRENGGDKYFRQAKWRKILWQIIEKFKRTNTLQERFETVEERDESIFEELQQSKSVIEERLKGKKVSHLCYPWYEAEDFSVRASVQAGYEVNYFGQRKGRFTNEPGGDPLNVVRVEDIFLQRLPGAGRQSLLDVFKTLNKMRSLPNRLGFVRR